MNAQKHEAAPRISGRHLSYIAFVAAVVVYLAIIQFGGRLIEGWGDETTP
ncbi:hypothetical protein [Rhodococcus sp. 24CO]